MKKCQVKHQAVPEGHTLYTNTFLGWDQLIFSMVNYKISLWECKNQVLSLSLKASKQTLFSKHFTARGEKAAGHHGSVEAYEVIQKKSLKEWEWKFTLINWLTLFILWFHEHLVPGSKRREGVSMPFLAELMLTVAYMAHETAVLIIHNHCLSLWSTPKHFHFLYHCAMQRP